MPPALKSFSWFSRLKQYQESRSGSWSCFPKDHSVTYLKVVDRKFACIRFDSWRVLWIKSYIQWFTYGIRLLDTSCISSLATLDQSMSVFFILVNLMLDLAINNDKHIYFGDIWESNLKKLYLSHFFFQHQMLFKDLKKLYLYWSSSSGMMASLLAV